MTKPVSVQLQFISEVDDFEKVLEGVNAMSLLGVNVTKGPGAVEPGERFVIEAIVDYRVAKAKPVLIEALDALEQLALSLETVVPETVRATLSVPPNETAITGEYLDFLEAKIDHLMVRTWNLQEQADLQAQDLADGLRAAQAATQRCESLFVALEQQGAPYFSKMFACLASAIENQTGVNPLDDFGVDFTIH